MADPSAVSPSRSLRRKRGALVVAALRRSWVLRACAALAFLEYGGLAMMAAFGSHLFKGALGLNFSLAGWLALCSLGSWFFIFSWLPFLQTLEARETGDGSALVMSRVLETFAIGCVVVVHLTLAAVFLFAL